MKMTKQDLIDNIEDTVNWCQSALMEFNDDEPLDGDETEEVAKLFLKELNKVNGNV